MCFPINSHWKEMYVARALDRNTACASQSASKDCRLATNQCFKSADLRQCRKEQTNKTNRAGFKTWPPACWPGPSKKYPEELYRNDLDIFWHTNALWAFVTYELIACYYQIWMGSGNDLFPEILLFSSHKINLTGTDRTSLP